MFQRLSRKRLNREESVIDRDEKRHVNSIAKAFDEIVTRSTQAFDETLDYSYESVLVQMLRFISTHPEHRVFFSERFKTILSSSSVPQECVAFCMHELRWREIKDFALAHFDMSTDPRSGAYLSLLNAYEDDWGDADLYCYYKRPRTELSL